MHTYGLSDMGVAALTLPKMPLIICNGTTCMQASDKLQHCHKGTDITSTLQCNKM